MVIHIVQNVVLHDQKKEIYLEKFALSKNLSGHFRYSVQFPCTYWW